MYHKKQIHVRKELKKYFEVVSTNEDGISGQIRCLHEDCLIKNAKPRAFTVKQGWATHIRHLESIHKIEKNAITEKEDNQNSVTPFIVRSKKLTKFSNENAYKFSHPKQETFMRDLMDLICIAGVPTNTIEHPIFMKFVRNLDRGIRLPSRRTVMDRIAKEAKRIAQINLKRLQSIKDSALHFSFDLWKSRSNRSVMGIKVHFIDVNWKLNNFTLAFVDFPDRKTAENIRKTFLVEIIKAANIKPEQIGFIMTDNARENVSAFGSLDILTEIPAPDDTSRQIDDEDIICWENTMIESENLLLEEFGEMESEEILESECDKIYDDMCSLSNAKLTRLGCIAHALQLVVKDCLKKNPTCQLVMSHVNHLITFLNQSTYWNMKLVKQAGKGLIKIGETRWNGFLLSLQRILEDNMIENLNKVLEEARKESSSRRTPFPDMISPERSQEIRELSDLLTPFYSFTQELQQDGITSSMVILGIITLYKKVASIQCDTDYMKALRASLCLSVSERFGAKDQYNYAGRGAKRCLLQVFQNEAYLLASVLDPRWKMAPFEVPLDEPYMLDKYVPDKTSVTELFRKVGKEIEAAKSDTNEPTSSEEFLPGPSPQKRPMCEFLETFLGSDLAVAGEQGIDEELTEYIKETRLPAKSCPLEYYRRMEAGQKFPILRKLAKRYLGFPATSSSVERVFSITGSFNRARRAKLATETMENMLLYRDFREEELQL